MKRKLIEDMHYQRVEFLRKGYPAPDTVIVPITLRYQFMGEIGDYCHLFANPDKALTVMDMRVRYSHDTSCIECALHKP